MGDVKNVHRIEVGISTSRNVRNDIIHDLNISDVSKVEVINVYTIEGGNLTREELNFLGKEVFSDPIVENFEIDQQLATVFPGSILEVGFKPGVTDNVGMTAVEAIKDAIGKDVKAVYSSKQYLLHGVEPKTAEIIAKDLIANQLIERWYIADGNSFSGFEIELPKVILDAEPVVNEINLNVSDAELEQISKEMVLALNLEEMKAIQQYFISVKDERLKHGMPINPTDVELECLAQTWSEHCCHKIFNAKIDYHEGDKQETIDSLFKTYIKKSTDIINSDYLVSVFKDNAGVIKFNEDYTFAMKVETHNSPTALDPYGGAITGIVGCNRDPAGTGKGFKLTFNTDVFCFASPFFKGEIPPRLFHPKRVLKGVHKGVIDGGNESGIPTVNGSLYFEDRYLGKPLVFVGTGGIAPASINNKPTHEKEALPGDYVVMVGGKIGADGIHGATFSSLEINEHSPATAVQIGAPIVQKKMLDFLLEARNQELFNAITDNGAGGLSSSIGEMGEEIGVRLDLDKAPLKYPGLMPWEILVSEAQERMSIAVPKDKIDAFMELSESFSVESTIVGSFNESKHFQLYYNNKLVGNLPMSFLHDGVPQKKMKGIWNKPTGTDPEFKEPSDYNVILKKMLGRLNICSKEDSILRKYDHEVQGTSIVKPFTGLFNDGPSDAAVQKPLFDSWEGIGVSHGLCPRYSDIDTYAMAANAIDEGVRNLVCVGTNPDYLAGLDNFCWAMGYDENDEIKYTGDLVRANKALFDVTTAYNLPCVSGKDSMRNDYRIGDTKVSVPPTLLYTVIGKLPDVRKAVTMDVKQENDLVYILGQTKKELGATEYLDEMKVNGFSVPEVHTKSAIERYRLVYKAIQEEMIQSAHDCSDGGLGVALAESAFAGGFGMEIDLAKVPIQENNHERMRNDYILFSESASRILVTIKPENQTKFEDLFKNTIYGCIGKVIGQNLKIKDNTEEDIIDTPIENLKEAWKATLLPLVEGG
ncbi:AIR synthase-related protein [Candidatus Lokiarchaeum ossiferum]|uniref:AIR synthase-related protein n=1 Tax=Candidatus Lokiarchaeum ossiferum TaxID=2951803 RepID=UPI00352D97E7